MGSCRHRGVSRHRGVGEFGYYEDEPVILETSSLGQVISAWPSEELTQADVEAWAESQGWKWKPIPGRDGIAIKE